MFTKGRLLSVTMYTRLSFTQNSDRSSLFPGFVAVIVVSATSGASEIVTSHYIQNVLNLIAHIWGMRSAHKIVITKLQGKWRFPVHIFGLEVSTKQDLRQRVCENVKWIQVSDVELERLR